MRNLGAAYHSSSVYHFNSFYFTSILPCQQPVVDRHPFRDKISSRYSHLAPNLQKNTLVTTILTSILNVRKTTWSTMKEN